MAGAYGVEVEGFEEGYVLEHAFVRDDVSAVGVYLVAVHAFEEDGLAVDEDLGVA